MKQFSNMSLTWERQPKFLVQLQKSGLKVCIDPNKLDFTKLLNYPNSYPSSGHHGGPGINLLKSGQQQFGSFSSLLTTYHEDSRPWTGINACLQHTLRETNFYADWLNC